MSEIQIFTVCDDGYDYWLSPETPPNETKLVLHTDYEASERRVKELEQANNIAMQMRNWLTIFSTRKRGLTDNDIKIMGRLVDAFDAAISGQGEKQ